MTPQITPSNDRALDLPRTRSPEAVPDDDLPHVATLDLTTSPKDLWQRVRNGFGMPNLDGPLVADRQAYYLNRPKMLQLLFSRSRKYLYYVVEELEKRGMPTELALLPMVESAYNPLAASPAKALGMWQFIPSTGKNYNLQQNFWMDQRRDIIASTGAALDYLQNIYEMHGDWHLALASYNWGENAVAKAIAKNQARGLPTDYLSLNMPLETRYYVPKLQALKNIIANPDLFGIQLDPIPNKPYFVAVDMPATMDVSMAAKLAEMPLDEFVALNPAHSKPVMQDTDNATLVLPAEKLSVFRSNLQRHEAEEKPLSMWHTYVMKHGDRLERIAIRHGLTTHRLKQINSIGPRTRVGTGFTLLVPDPFAQNQDSVLALLQRESLESAKPVHGKAHRATAKAGKRKRTEGTHARAGNKKVVKKASARKSGSSKAASSSGKSRKKTKR
ncbi:MAG TPA: transglycosylase SLT domain-containing protein [Rhodocyclaceae bacterium]|nr:transglycosylase SLT domain-containing protein [Rhodocyclaceae bacterium]